MAKKYKLTGCARFMIFLLIVGPLVFFGVAFAKGENPLAAVQDFFSETTEKVIDTKERYTKNNDAKKVGTSDVEEADILDATIEAQKTRIAEQAEKIEKLENEVKQLKDQLSRQVKRDVPVSKSVGN